MSNNFKIGNDLNKVLKSQVKLATDYSSVIKPMQETLKNLSDLYTSNIVEISQSTQSILKTLNATTLSCKEATESITKAISNINTRISIDPMLTTIKLQSETLQSMYTKYFDSSSFIETELHDDAKIISECQIDLEDISIQQMSDVLTGAYEDSIIYDEPDIDSFNKQANAIDIINNFENSTETLFALMDEARKFKNNHEANNTLSRIFLESVVSAVGEKLVSVAFWLIIIWILYNIQNLETVKEFISFLKEIV